MRKQYNGLDFAKFIAAWFVIIIHTAPFASYSKAVTYALRHIVTPLGVPLFFAVSGYLFCEKYDSLALSERGQYVKSYTFRIIKMYLFWSVVYLPFVIVKWLRAGFDYTQVLEYVKDFFFEGSYSTIWFLPALLTAVLAVYLLGKRFKYRQIFIVALIVHIFTLGATSYYGLATRLEPIAKLYNAYYSFFDTAKNGILFGFLYVSMGGMIFELRNKLKLNPILNAALIVFFYIALAGEAAVGTLLRWSIRGCDTTLMLIPLTFFALIFALNLKLPDSDVYAKMRKYSILMFLTQRIPISIIEMWFADTLLCTNSLIFFVVISASTLLLSAIILNLSTTKHFKLLKQIY